MAKKFLIYFDILGFEKLAIEIAKKSGFKEDVIREDYLSNPLEKRIKQLTKEKYTFSKGLSEIEGSDNYLILVNDILTIFKLVGEFSQIQIPHKDFKNIPLEIAIDSIRIDEEVEVELKNRKETIQFLKSDIVNPYRKYHTNNIGELKETFVLLTKKIFNELGSLDKKSCEYIKYETKDFYIFDLKKIRQKFEISKFLKKIKYTDNKLYERIVDVYVPPIEYKDMEKTLRVKRFLFITGTREYGKTYTAVKFLWEYYKKGYEPKWIKGDEPLERLEVRKRLESIDLELKPRHIIYFEDPFGKIKYERRENLEREIGTLIDTVNQVDDVYVIVTSREEIFKEFKKEALSTKELEKFEQKISIKKPSYDQNKRIKILLNWAEAEGCKWLENYTIKKSILKLMENEGILSTPLSMKDFAITTVKTENKDELIRLIHEKSMETSKQFAQEIMHMKHDKLLFLSLIFIPNKIEIDLAEKKYNELKIKLNLDQPWEFTRLLNWFKKDKINLHEKKLEFSHPSYYGAFSYLLVEEENSVNKEIFSKVFHELSEHNKIAAYVASIIVFYYNILPTNVQEILFRISGKLVKQHIIFGIIQRYYELPENVREFLFKLIEKKDDQIDEVLNYSFAIGAIIPRYNIFPKKIKDIVTKAIEKDHLVAFVVLGTLIKNFDSIPAKIRNKFIKIFESKIKKDKGFALLVSKDLLKYKAKHESSKKRIN